MTHNRRYEQQNDAELDALRAVLDSHPRPVIIPVDAYGPQPLERSGRRMVWAWVGFTDGSTRRIPGIAVAWNDRVVEIEWSSVKGGGVRSSTVWRSAVTVKTGGSSNADDYLPWLAALPSPQERRKTPPSHLG